MSEKDYDVPIEGHDYDGIEELNNPLPKWWLATFYGAIVFAVIYYGYYQLGPGPSSDETLARRMDKVTEAQAASTAALSAGDEQYDVAAMLADEDILAIGKARFKETCVACHGENGEGSVGPNLTDDYWVHSRGGMPGILASIRQGFPEKGMPPWGGLIPAEEHAPVAVYVISLRGTGPPNAKAAEGQLVPRSEE